MEFIACKNETNATDMDLKQMMNRAIPTTKEAKCLTACFLNIVGVVSYLNRKTVLATVPFILFIKNFVRNLKT